MRRFFLDREKIGSDRPTLTGPDVRHIRTVLRLKPGDEVFLFDGKGSEYRARITASTSRAIILSVLERSHSVSESPVQITMGQGLLKARKMDRVVRQITELGVYALIPVLTERSVPRPRPEHWTQRGRRWQTIAHESLKQCGRSQIPRLEPATPFKALVAMTPGHDLNIIFHGGEVAKKPLRRMTGSRDVRKVLALIGPEGGFTPDEVKMAVQGGFACISLGPRILKADTAVVAACAMLQYAFGDGGAFQEKS